MDNRQLFIIHNQLIRLWGKHRSHFEFKIQKKCFLLFLLAKQGCFYCFCQSSFQLSVFSFQFSTVNYSAPAGAPCPPPCEPCEALDSSSILPKRRVMPALI